jgi:4-hydroxy-2-oxoglutarate aldolase
MPTPDTVGGIIAPVATPFDASGDAPDLAAFAANIRGHLAAGLDGIVVAGSTGEAALLSESERATLFECARSVVPGDRWLIAGVGAESTKLTVERARAAATRGADAVLVVAPHYYPESTKPDALIAHYTRIADESPIPVMLYSIPKYMHFALPAQVVYQLAEHRNIIGMKDSAGDVAGLTGYLAAQSPTFSVLTGNGSTFHAAVTAGVRGGILAVALIAPTLCLTVFEAARNGRDADAAAAQALLLPLGRDVVGALGVPGVKAALDVIGLNGGRVRSPLQPLRGADYQRVVEVVETALARSAVPA